MHRKIVSIFISFALMIVSLGFSITRVSAQRGPVKTDTRISYHNGPVMTGTSAIYLIWYGNWTGNTAQSILTDLASNIGSSPYFLINTTYPDLSGGAPSGGLIYAGAVYDSYSQGPSLSVANVKQIVAAQLSSGHLPLDTAGIYLVIGSSDVTDIRPDGTTFCTPGAQPHHGLGEFSGTLFKYGYIGGAARCPTIAGPQLFGLTPPNDNFSADAMASTMAHLLSVIVTSPSGPGAPYGGWYDRYGLENADKCAGQFGTTYAASNGGPANIRLGARDYLIQQNWVNARKGYCALSY